MGRATPKDVAADCLYLLDEGDAAACMALWAMSLQWSPSLQRLFHRGLARTRARPVSISVPTDLGAHRQYSFEHPYGFGERRFAPLALLTRQCFWIYIACGLPSYRVTRPADCRKLIKTVRAVPSISSCNKQARTVESKSPKSTRAFASPLVGAQQKRTHLGC